MAHQAVMKKIQFLLRQNGVFGYRGGAVSLELKLDERQSFPLESKCSIWFVSVSRISSGIYHNYDFIVGDN